MEGHTAFRLKLPNGAVIEFEGDQEYIDSKIPDWTRIESLVNINSPASSPAPSTSTAMPSIPTTQSATPPNSVQGVTDYTRDEIKNFIQEYEVKNSPQQQVAAFVYFLQVIKGWPRITYEDLEECFSLAGQKIPEVKKAVSNSERRFRLVERQKDGAVSITRIGRNFVEDKSQKEPSRVGRSQSRTVLPKQAIGSKKKPPAVVKINGNLNLYGRDGDVSFRDFAGRANPKSTVDRFAVSAYYLTQILGQEQFDESDLYTCLQHMTWKSPNYLRNNVINHKNQYGFYTILESGGFAITMTLKHYVEQDLGTNSTNTEQEISLQ